MNREAGDLEKFREEWITNALSALGRHDASRQAGPAVEAKVMAAFRARQKTSSLRNALWIGIAAGIVLAAAYVSRTTQQGLQSVALEARGQETPRVPSITLGPSVTTVIAPKTGPPNRPVRRPRFREAATDFISLMNPAPPFERGQIVRVQLPAAAMRTVGLPVAEERLEDPVQADVLIGEEGLARAIRFVRMEPVSLNPRVKGE